MSTLYWPTSNKSVTFQSCSTASCLFTLICKFFNHYFFITFISCSDVLKTFYNVINRWRHDLIYLNCRYTNSWLASLWASCKIFTKTGEKASAFTDRWVDKVTNFPQGNNSFFSIEGCTKKISALDQRKGFLLKIIIGEKRWKVH